MNYQEYIPAHPQLREFIDCFWTISFPGTQGFSARDLVMPDGGVEWVFLRGEGFQRKILGKPKDEPVFISHSTLVGQRKTAVLVQQSPRNHLFVIRFKPYGLHGFRFKGIKELTDQVADSNYIFGELTGRVTEELQSGRGILEIVGNIERLLLRHLDTEQYLHPVLPKLWQSILQSGGQLGIKEFCASTGVHKSTLEKLCMDHVGIGPKALAGIIRINHTISALYSEKPLTQIGLKHGYFDQSHMIRDFKRYTGTTPLKFKKGDYHLPTLLSTVNSTRKEHLSLGVGA